MTLQLVKLNRLTMPVIRLTIKGVEHLFIVDTGAEKSLINPFLVRNRPIKKMESHGGIGGGDFSPVIDVTFNLLGVTLNSVNSSERLFRDLARHGHNISGLIGQDILSQFSSYTIDNQKQRITFNK